MDPFDFSYGSSVRAAAARVALAGAELRERAGRLRAASATCEWDGAGARAFRTSSAATSARIERAGQLLDEAAAALRAHATVAADAIAEDVARRARLERELLERAAQLLHVPHTEQGR